MPSNDDLWTGGDVYVSPRYLAGLPGHADPSFHPVAHWPHYRPDAGPCQLVVTSPDHRIRIGWLGDNHDIWLISAAEDPSPPPVGRHASTRTPHPRSPKDSPALVTDWDEDSDSFLISRSYYWSDAVRPFLDAGWEQMPLSRGTVEIVSPDGLAGASIDVVSAGPDAETVTLWAGPPGWGTRAEAAFTARTPKHLIAATAAALADPTPVLRCKDSLNPKLAQLARLTPVTPPRPPAPTPLDVQRAAAARSPAAVPARSVRRWTTATPPPAPAIGPRPGLRR